MKITALTILSFIAAVSASNPKVTNPLNMTYTAGDTMDIQWSEAKTGYLNIDVVSDDPNILAFPMNIAQGVPAEAGHYSWSVPQSLRSAVGYRVRVWGSHQPATEDNGISKMFTVLNNIPGAINTFVVSSPNKDQPCEIGKSCKISWDYPEEAIHPHMVNIALYKVGVPEPVMHIATIPASEKSFTWAVPNDAELITSDVYVSVSGEGNPTVGPGMSNNMGSNSHAFAINEPQPEAPAKADEPEKEDKTDDDKKKKVTAESKKEKNAAVSVSVSQAVAIFAGLSAAVFAFVL